MPWSSLTLFRREKNKEGGLYCCASLAALVSELKFNTKVKIQQLWGHIPTSRNYLIVFFNGGMVLP
jgi:hypothetical protein